MLDQVLGAKGFVGKKLARSTYEGRAVLQKFRQLANRKDYNLRRRVAAQMNEDAAFEIKKEKGFEILNDHSFEEIPEIVACAKEVALDEDLLEKRDNSKPQLYTGLLKKDSLSLDSPFVKFALRKDIISAIANYLGAIPLLDNIDIWYSQSSPELSNSQLHHCDWAAQTQMKIFVYATDVEEDHGPLVVMDAEKSRMLRNKIHYTYREKITDDVVDKYVQGEDQHAALGRAGTIVFADTSKCFHYGSRVKKEAKPRVLAMFQYLCPDAFRLPLDYKKSRPFAFLNNPELPEYQKLVLGVE